MHLVAGHGQPTSHTSVPLSKVQQLDPRESVTNHVILLILLLHTQKTSYVLGEIEYMDSGDGDVV